MGNVTLSMEEYKELEARERSALDQVVALKRELVEAKLRDPESRVQALNSLCRYFIGVTRFAVGNLPPETIVGWPWANLMEIAARLKNDLPDFFDDDESFVLDLTAFAKECAAFETERRTRKP